MRRQLLVFTATAASVIDYAAAELRIVAMGRASHSN